MIEIREIGDAEWGLIGVGARNRGDEGFIGVEIGVKSLSPFHISLTVPINPSIVKKDT